MTWLNVLNWQQKKCKSFATYIHRNLHWAEFHNAYCLHSESRHKQKSINSNVDNLSAKLQMCSAVGNQVSGVPKCITDDLHSVHTDSDWLQHDGNLPASVNQMPVCPRVMAVSPRCTTTVWRQLASNQVTLVKLKKKSTQSPVNNESLQAAKWLLFYLYSGMTYCRHVMCLEFQLLLQSEGGFLSNICTQNTTKIIQLKGNL